MTARMVLESLKMAVRTECKQRWVWQGPVGGKKVSELKCSTGCELDKLRDTEVSIVEKLVSEEALPEEMCGDVVEGAGLEKRNVLCKEEVPESNVGVLLVCAGEFWLKCKESLY